MLRTPTVCLAACLGIAAIPASAQADGSSWTLGGFGTFGVSRSSTDDALFIREQSQPLGVGRDLDGRIDSRLGLQFSGPLGDTLRATLQVVGKYRYDHTFTPDLTWALLAWSPTPELQVRAGRLGFDVFMDSDSRDVGYSFLWARPPVEYFGGLPISHLDGADLARHLTFGDGTTLRLKAYAGVASEKVPAGGPEPLDLGGSRLVGALGEVTAGPWRARLGYAQFRPEHEFPAPIADVRAGLNQFAALLGDPRIAKAADDLRFTDHLFRYSSAALSFEQDGLQAQAALARLRTHAVIAPDAWSGFLSVGYRVGPVVPYATWSRIVSSRPTVDLGSLPSVPVPEARALVEGLAHLLRTSQNDQHTWTLGARWNLADRACLKFQADHSRTHAASALWAQVRPGWSGSATLFTATLDFVF